MGGKVINNDFRFEIEIWFHIKKVVGMLYIECKHMENYFDKRKIV